MSQLLVTLSPPGSDQAELAYAVVASSGALTAHGRAAPALLPKADTATLIVPAQAVAWHAAQLPKLQRGNSAQKMQLLLAGVLEEQLLDDPAQTHLAACPSISADGKTWVAAINKAWLQDAVAALQAARVPLTRIVPQVFPSEPAQLHASGTSDAPWLTFADTQGVLCLPLNQAALLPALPEDLAITAEPAVAAAAEQALGQRVNVLQAAQLALQTAQAAQASGVDLAQGDLAVSGGGRAWQSFTGFLGDVFAAPAWQPVRWGLGLLLMANVIGLNAWSYKQSNEAQAKRLQMNQILTQSFPNVKVVVDAPLQMQRELASLRQAQGQLSGRDFESIYGRFSSIAGMNTAPDAIEYIANEVQIRGSGLQTSQLDALLPRLQYVGLGVKSDAQALIVSHQDASIAPAVAVVSGAKP
ncbi:type II secretion system protein GspL [Variovorax sp. PCZ-1]|uniref:type II secretion system protein GspL n=1 Tax=Variovorax sp. PCZ-1 TaxID=2835533 RepID=UPI001BCE3F97|nr:type II secretion system protein GspL [Variovorax sp. PCZ-1]MBS7806180.1 general secretion pathway protein GspL [Variovorax sp. PCZ-1]